MTFPTWGGKRARAGRKRVSPRPRVSHKTRPALSAHHPVHVTVRVRPGVPRLRGFKPAAVLKTAFVRTCDKGTFRICQFSVQGNHVHLVCEARDAMALARGIQGWKVSVVRQLNRHWGREGKLFDDRYHATALTSPTQVRNALCYVMQNALRHGETVAKRAPDLFSSAWYFDGWKTDDWRERLIPPDNTDGPPVIRARTWLLRDGWRRRGLIGIDEVPAGN